MKASKLSFEDYIKRINAEWDRLGCPECKAWDPEIWLEFYEEDVSPEDAVDEEISCWGD